MMKATANRRYFDELMKNRLFFIEKSTESLKKFYKSTRTEIKTYISESEERIFKEIFPLENALCVIEDVVARKSDSDSVTFSFHAANPQSQSDWIVIFNSLINHSQNSEDKFPYKYILWFLNHSNWNVEQLISAIGQYDLNTQPYILKWLQKICRCLSYQKQKRIKVIARHFNVNFDIYLPFQITEALKCVTPAISILDHNLFDLVDHILGDDDIVLSHECYYEYDENGNPNSHKVNTASSNVFICLYKWFNSDEEFKYYHLLKSIYPLVSQERQLKIIQRYFHDLRLGNVNFDENIIKQFRNNDYEEFIRYRYCITTPDSKINIGNQLLCDCILTLTETHGKSLQSFNGILDFAINHCDITNPKIDLGLYSFLPYCDGGTIINQSFKGFIDYCIIVCLDENKFTPENLNRTIKQILDSKGRKKVIFTCKFDDNKKILDETSICRNCLDCIETTYEDKWIVSYNDNAWLMLFMEKFIPENNYEISMDDVSIEKMRNSIIGVR